MRTFNCPSCGAEITLEVGNRDFGFCQYCGSKIMLDDYRITHRYVDEAQITQSENEKILRLKELEIQKANQSRINMLTTPLTIIWLLLSFVILISCVVKWALQDDWTEAYIMLFCLGVPVIGGGAYLIFKFIPDRDQDRIALNSGGIRFPKSIEPFQEQNYLNVKTVLSNTGFRNITCINLHDVKLGLLQKPDTVETISVGGTNIMSGGRVYMPDTPIIITYHGK